MADIKKVIKGIECCICQGKTRGPCSPECPYEVIEPDCWIVMNEDVLELLKEQEQLKIALSEGQKQVQSLLSSGRELEETINILKGEIDRLKAEQPKWVSVSERLPEEKISPITHDYTEVVCYTSFGDVRVYKFGDGHFYKGPGIMDYVVTHWQYLPTPPKAGEKE